MQYCHFSKSKSAAALHRIAILGLAWLLVYWCLQSLYEKESYGFINKAGNWAIGFEFGTDFKDNPVSTSKFSCGWVRFGHPRFGSRTYLNKAGKLMNVEFEDCKDFSEGLAEARKNGKWGFVDLNGKYVVAPSFQETRHFSCGLAAVRLNDKWGFVEKEGKTRISPQYENAAPFSEGLAAVRRDGKWGFIDEHGELVIPNIYEEVRRFSGGLAAVAESKSAWKFIDTTGATRFNLAEGKLSKDFSDRKIYNELDSVTNHNCDLKLQCLEFSEKLLPAFIGEKWGYLDESGNVVIQPQFLIAAPFSEGVAVVAKQPGKFVYIDKSGNELFAGKEFDYATSFSEGRALVFKKSKDYFYIDRSGKQVGSKTFCMAHPFSDGYALVNDYLTSSYSL